MVAAAAAGTVLLVARVTLIRLLCGVAGLAVAAAVPAGKDGVSLMVNLLKVSPSRQCRGKRSISGMEGSGHSPKPRSLLFTLTLLCSLQTLSSKEHTHTHTRARARAHAHTHTHKFEKHSIFFLK